MFNFQPTNLVRSGCVHFVHETDANQPTGAVYSESIRIGMDWVYLDCASTDCGLVDIVNGIALGLNLANAPYNAAYLLQLMDDLISLSVKSQGLLIVIVNAQLLLDNNQKLMFELIEVFLTQFHHWFNKKKPSHICFEMNRDPALLAFFSRMRAAAQ